MDLDHVKNMLDLATELMRVGSDYREVMNALGGIAKGLSKYVQELVSKSEFLTSVSRVAAVGVNVKPRELRVGDMTVKVDELRVSYGNRDGEPEVIISFRYNDGADHVKINLCRMDADDLIFLHTNMDTIIGMLREAVEVKRGKVEEMRRRLKDITSSLSELLST